MKNQTLKPGNKTKNPVLLDLARSKAQIPGFDRVIKSPESIFFIIKITSF